MAKRKAASYMTSGERLAGVILFLIYLVVLPFVLAPFFNLCEDVVGAPISQALRSGIYYCVLFVVCIFVFRKFLGRTTENLGNNLGPACQMVLLGLVGLYGLNELIYRLSSLVIKNVANMNDVTISAQVDDAPKLTFIIIVLVAPFVEEVLFRGLVFGNLKGKSLTVAYVLSCVLFALSHVWQFAVDAPTVAHFVVMLQYLAPGFVLAWSYDRSGTLWTPIALHAVFNALALWT